MSPPNRQFKKQVCGIIKDYEVQLGPIPVWFEELEPDEALSLLSVCLRIGLRLPAEETLQMDRAEQLIDRWYFRGPRWLGPAGLARKPEL